MSLSLVQETGYNLEFADDDLLPHSIEEWVHVEESNERLSLRPPGLYKPSSSDFNGSVLRGEKATRDRFNELSDRWLVETAFSSSTAETSQHPAFLGIVGLGLEALHLIAEDIRKNPSPGWFPALVAIVGRDEAYGSSSVKEATELWLRWLREQGYVS